MRVLLKLTLDCDTDAAWRALHSPRAAAELYGPLLGMAVLAPDELPTTWDPARGDDEAGVVLSIGPVLMGRQLIRVSNRETTDPRDGEPVRIFRDSGIPISGPLASLDVWDHQVAVSAAPGGRTLWRDRLVIRGAAAPLLWPGLWAMWQWRAARLRQLAPTWAHDVPED